MRWLTGFGFAAMAVTVLFLMHRYAWVRLVRDTRLARSWHTGASVLLGLLFLALPAAFVWGHRSPLEGRLWFTLGAFAWLGFLFYAVLLLVLSDGARWLGARARLRRVPPDRSEAGISRRQALSRLAAGVVVGGAGGIAFSGYRSAVGEIETPEIPVRLARLPRALDGLRIAQLSDLHLGPLLDERFLRAVVERTNALRPDLVVITGDLVDGSVDVLGRQLEPLSRLQSRWGTFFVTGNHEYYSDADGWIDFLRARGVRVLLNERVSLGEGAASLDLAGVPDWRSSRLVGGHPSDLRGALSGRDPERELVLLAHQPAHVDEAADAGVGLQLSGHTHGGQMWPFGRLVMLAQPYIEGLHRHADGAHRSGTWVYVSRGTGFWGPPMRVAAPAEIGCIVLTT